MIINPYVYGSGAPVPPPDPFIANVSSLLHFENNLTDTKGKVWTPTGAMAYVTSTPLYGVASLGPLLLSAYLVSASSADFNFGTGDFTIELSFRVPAGSTPASTYMLDAGSGNLTVIQFNPSGRLCYYDPVTGTAGSLYTAGPLPASFGDGNRHVVAVCRNSGTIRAFYDGVQWGSQTGATHNKTHTTFCLNKYGGGVVQGTPNSVYDELRITKGVGRYTANYTPSSLPFSDV